MANKKMVLSGSGMLYPVHAGIVNRVAQDHKITHLAGVSGGALVASLFASGFQQNSLREMILQTLPADNNLIDVSWMPWRGYGLISGNRILSMLRKYIPTTFKEAYQKTGIHLTVITANLTRRKFCEWSSTETPDADLPLVVRASMSIPFVFKYVDLYGDMHIDGGVMSNFPLDLYGDGEDVIGSQIHADGPEGPKRKPVDGLLVYVRTIVDVMMKAIIREHVEDAIHARQIISKPKVSSLDFDVTKKQADQLYLEGFQNADTWLKENADLSQALHGKAIG